MEQLAALQEVLDAREEKVFRLNRLRETYKTDTIITLGMNIPR